jgi:hypothetical protein
MVVVKFSGIDLQDREEKKRMSMAEKRRRKFGIYLARLEPGRGRWYAVANDL